MFMEVISYRCISLNPINLYSLTIVQFKTILVLSWTNMIGGVDLSDNAVLTKELTRYYSIWQEINYIYDEWAKSHGISVSYLLVLAAIDEAQDECTQKKISQRYMIPKQTVNAALKDLEQKGYVVLHPMLKDKRNKQISFTEIGQAYADSILNELRRVELSAIEKIGSERMRRFNDDGELFIKFLSEAGDKNTNA